MICPARANNATEVLKIFCICQIFRNDYVASLAIFRINALNFGCESRCWSVILSRDYGRGVGKCLVLLVAKKIDDIIKITIFIEALTSQRPILWLIFSGFSIDEDYLLAIGIKNSAAWIIRNWWILTAKSTRNTPRWGLCWETSNHLEFWKIIATKWLSLWYKDNWYVHWNQL